MKTVLKSILLFSAILMSACGSNTPKVNCLGTEAIPRSELPNFLVDSISRSKFEFAGGFVPASSLAQLLDSLEGDTIFIGVAVSTKGFRELELSGKRGSYGDIRIDTMSFPNCYLCQPHPPCCPNDTLLFATH